MMKKILVLTVAVLSALSIQAQKKSLLDYQEIQLGTYADGKPFLCHFISTDGELKRFTFVSDQHLMLIGDKRGNKLYDTETCEEIAEPDFKKQQVAQINRKGYLVYSPGKMFSFRYGQPTFFNYKGEKVWTSKDELIIANRSSDVAICVGNRRGDLLNAYELSTGKLLWSKTITGKKHDLTADAYFDVADKRILYLKGDSLIRLNTVTGDTIRHAFTAGIKEPTKSIFSLAKMRATLPSGDFTQEAISSAGMSGILTGTHSNIIFSGDSLFVADAEHLYCFDKNLKERWVADLPAESGSKSTIKIFGNQIRMQNYGIAFQNLVIGRCGRSFTATFDRNTGKQLSLEMIDIKKKVIGGLMVKGRTYWQTDNQFFYNEEGDSTIHEIAWKPNTTRAPQETHPNYMICDTVGIVKDGTFQYVITDKNQLVVEVYGQDVNVIKADGSCERIPADSVYLSDGNDVYSTNNIGEEANTFIIVDRKTRKVECTLRLKGKVSRDKAGNVYVLTKQGVGFHRKG